MTVSLRTHLDRLNKSLQELNATGESGFEGLLGEALSELTGIPFRLANSAYQRGLDGKSAFEGAVAFEGKLYTGALPRKDVLSKIPDLVRHNQHADLLWVLGATSMVPSQLADDLRADGVKHGVSVLVLDWVPSDFPRLGVMLAMGANKVEDFLRTHLTSDAARDDAIAALAAIRGDDQFARHAAAVRKCLDAPGMATAMAERANADWFAETVSDRAGARAELGQPLALADPALTILKRDQLIDTLGPYFTDGAGDGVVCVHGEEGCGKSWIVLQTWLEQPDKPLLVFATPDYFSQEATQADIEDLLIAKLVAQTGDTRSEASTIRWRRRLFAWKAAERPCRPRLVVVVDGINQRPHQSWGKIISSVETYVGRRGGRVVFTARTHYFSTRVKRALLQSPKEVEVPRWSASERDRILKHRKIPVNSLKPAVAAFLRNPRILSIALEVFGHEIAAFEELSVDRLLFEHIMAGVRHDYGNDPVEFVAHLRSHARELLNRATAQNKDDLHIFESSVPAVADGRFFHPVEGEPRKYQLRDDGLSLALGLSIIENLRSAERNHRNLDDGLKEILEPIEALDRTAEAVLAAITVTAADDNEYSPAVARALIKGFSELQNPPALSLAALVSFARARPMAFAETARDLCLEGRTQPNHRWIRAALNEVAQSDAVWTVLAPEVRRWLRAYSPSPELRMGIVRVGTPETIVQQMTRLQAEINERIQDLSPAEKGRHARLVQTEGERDVLSHLALRLLAGKKLAPLAEALVDWSFANTLNGTSHVPMRDFNALISLNRRDWSETRDALLQQCRDFCTGAVSNTGKRVLSNVLSATGAPEDDWEARVLRAELNDDRPPMRGPRTFDAKADPCDPAATRPFGLTSNLQKYEKLDVTTLRQGIDRVFPDHVFVGDRPAAARFALDVAVAKHRELATDVANRAGTPLRQGLLELRKHAALISREQALALVDIWTQARARDDFRTLPEDDRLVLQDGLVIAFPFLEPIEQIDILLATTENEPLLLDLVDGTKAPDAATFDRFLDDARSTGVEHRQRVLLEIAAAAGAELSSHARAYFCTLMSSPRERLRSSAQRLAARSGHPDLLKAVVESDWEASPVDNGDDSNSWYGSYALLKGAEIGLIDGGAVLDRISPRLYGRAALMLKGPATQEIARRVDASIRRVIALPDELVAPAIEMEVEGADLDEPPCFYVTARPTRGPSDFIRKLSESEGGSRGGDNGYEAFLTFRDRLTAASANIILDHLTHEEFAAIVAANPPVAEQWYDLFMDMNDSKLPAVHNLVLLLASALSDIDPDKSLALFHRSAHIRPLVRFNFGKTGVDFGSLSAWRGPRTSAFDEMRRKRLDYAETDQALATEVLSALQNGHQSFLEAYVDEKLSRSEPAEIARGLMVVGLSDQSERHDQLLKRYEATDGLPGWAWTEATAAYRRNIWARHWFKAMCETEDPESFWQAAVLFEQCVDARFQTWRNDYSLVGRPFAAFGGNLRDVLPRRYEKLSNERERNLFGRKAPAPIFVRSLD
ncbi:hypothetical protein PWG15_26590 (plasmid) [Ensifer adhaerens]|uniref:hypothetical protein n=1 Tax=Ensifer adhaerens TaxID=106592 RepID=UPI0023A9B306|nr:hypothetical protein [Ensifer adhaerens]WDZ79057.1 hypothetical protein PWG15_26590 [Ensifer adhaerens]